MLVSALSCRNTEVSDRNTYKHTLCLPPLDCADCRLTRFFCSLIGRCSSLSVLFSYMIVPNRSLDVSIPSVVGISGGLASACFWQYPAGNGACFGIVPGA